MSAISFRVHPSFIAITLMPAGFEKPQRSGKFPQSCDITRSASTQHAESSNHRSVMPSIMDRFRSGVRMTREAVPRHTVLPVSGRPGIGLLLADSRLSAHDHKAAVRHSGRNVQTLHSLSGTHFRTDFISPDQWSRRPAKTAFRLIHTPHGARLPARLRPLLATLLRACFDSLSIRSGRARARARWSGGAWRQAGTGVCIK
jgi:hypothetical protein